MRRFGRTRLLLFVLLLSFGSSRPVSAAPSAATAVAPATSVASSATPVAGPAALADPATAALDSPIPFDPDVVTGRLENGLRYYIRENREPRDRAELRLVVNVGSLQEEDDQQGIAHFVEHMAFNGTEHFAAQELVDYLQSIGMRFGPDLNASTSFDETTYMLKVPTDSTAFVAQAFQVLEDWAHGISFDPVEVDKERGVVIEEWRLRRGATGRMRDQQLPILYENSRYAQRLPIGKKDILESFDVDMPRRFYETWYRPELMAVVAVGDFDAGTIETLIREHFAGLKNRPGAPERKIYEVPDHARTLFAIATDEEATRSSVRVYAKRPRQDDATHADFRRSLVEDLYTSMLNTRFEELARRPDPPFIGAGNHYGPMARSKDAYVLSAMVEDGGIGRGLEAILTEAERVRRHGFTTAELEFERKSMLRGVKSAFAEREKTESSVYVSRYVRNFLTGAPSAGIEYAYGLYRRFLPTIQLEEINQLAEDWMAPRSRVVLVNAPRKEGVTVPNEDELTAVFDRVAAADIQPYEEATSDGPLVDAVPSPADIVEESAIDTLGVTVWRLANGVRVMLKPTDFKDDEILFRAWSPGGTSLASDDHFLSALLATSIVEQGGLGRFDPIALEKRLADQDVSVRPDIGSLTEGLSGSASPSDVETLFKLIYLYFTAPRRDEDAFTSFKSRYQAMLAHRDANPQAAFSDTLRAVLTQHHFRTRPLTAERLDDLNLDDALAFYRDRFADASDFNFVFVGSFDLSTMRPLVQTWLGGLPSLHRVESWRDENIEPPEGVITKVVEKGIEPKSVTQIVFTGPFEWNRHDRYALASLEEVLQLRLREVLREDLSGTYGVSVSTSKDLIPKPEYTVSIAFGADPGRLEELSARVFAEIAKLQQDGPTDEEILKVQQTQRRQMETSLRRNGFWLSQLVYVDRYGIDPLNIIDYEPIVASLDRAMMIEASRTYLRTDNYVQVSLYPQKPVTPQPSQGR